MQDCLDLSEYADPGLYDLENTLGTSEKYFFLDQAEDTGGPVLDLACGTGRLSIPIAAEGFDVVGLDLSDAMLTAARRKAGGLPVIFEKADCRNFRIAQWFSLAIMTGHSFQSLITEADQRAVLAAVYDHLLPFGLFVFETRNPTASDLTDTRPRRPWRQMTGPGGQRVFCDIEQDYDPAEAVLRYRVWRHGDGVASERESGGLLRFTGDATLRGLIDEAGFNVLVSYGNWDRSPITPDAPELIYICQRRERPC